jgi:hypothetical protein
MESFVAQRRALKIAVAAAALVPVLAGLWGVIAGLGAPADPLDSHHRFMSGILLGAGLGFWWTIPGIERRGMAFRLLTALIVTGGLARLGAALAVGGRPVVWAALFMELVITPALCLWRERVDRMDPDAPPRYGGPWG